MAVHTPVEAEKLDAFLAAYGLPPADLFEGISEGVENSNFKVDAGGKALILTLFERRTEETDLPYFLALMDHVAEKGLPAPRPLADLGGTMLRRLQGKPAVLVERLPGRWPKVPVAEEARAAGHALARLHLAAADFSPRRANALGPAGWRGLAGIVQAELSAISTDLPAQIARLAAKAEAVLPALPQGTVHADLFPDNVLMEGATVTGLIDFYFACTDALAYDLAVGINAWTPEPGGEPEGEQGPGPGQTPDPALGTAFRQGYEALRPLGEEERTALPVLLAGSACRFFLTRLHDLHHPPAPGAGGKDPLPYLRLMRHHLSCPGDRQEA